jgi:hypothetical protein
MSKTTPKKDLLRDIESYTCGEAPGAIELLRAPVIDKWSTEVRRRGKEFVLVVRGQALRHPEYEDGSPIATAAVMWLDRGGRFARTATRLYTLGYPAGEDVGGGDK